MVLGDASQQLWAFLSHPRMFSSSAWALGLILKWAGSPRSFGSTYIYIYIYIYIINEANLKLRKQNKRKKNVATTIALRIHTFVMKVVGLKDLGAPAHFNIKPKTQVEEENVRR